jgi:hypothetical protein
MASKYQGLSAAQQAAVSAAIAGNPIQTKWNSYYSRIRITCTGGSSGVPYTVAAGNEFQAFGYSRNGDMTAAGLAGVQATPADTNILTPNQTISGEMILIAGIGIIALTQSDALLLKYLDQCVSVKIKTNGTQEYLMGVPSMVPGPGGLFGNSEALSATPDFQSVASRSFGVISNGIPHCSNYFPLPEPMIWASSGNGDSNFNVIFKTERAVTLPANWSGTTRAGANTTGVSGTGFTYPVAAYTAPADTSVFVDYMTVIIGMTINPLSDN